MINFAAMMVLKAVWGQGHGRERSYGMDDCPGSLTSTLNWLTSQLRNCPKEYVVVNAKFVNLQDPEKV